MTEGTEPRADSTKPLTRADVERIVKEAKNRGERPDLVGALLTEADLTEVNLGGANLSGANLSGANLSGANLSGANLSSANLRADLRADLREADLRFVNARGATVRRIIPMPAADLSDANLECAGLVHADLSDANLERASLVHANLSGANLSGANLSGANLSGAVIASTLIDRVDLSGVGGMAQAMHLVPSPVSVSTLELTAKGLVSQPQSRREEVFVFLRGTGLNDDMLELVRTWIAKPIEFYSCFISYSHADREFARLLNDTLQDRGVRCWLDEHQLLAGDNIYDVVDRGIRLWDKVLLCCSEAALTSWWVDKELSTALEKEQGLQKQRGSKVQVVIPLDLDGYLLSWGGGKAATLRERYAPPFSGWQHDAGLFGARVDNVMRALRSDDGGREPPPPPKL